MKWYRLIGKQKKTLGEGLLPSQGHTITYPNYGVSMSNQVSRFSNVRCTCKACWSISGDGSPRNARSMARRCSRCASSFLVHWAIMRSDRLLIASCSWTRRQAWRYLDGADRRIVAHINLLTQSMGHSRPPVNTSHVLEHSILATRELQGREAHQPPFLREPGSCTAVKARLQRGGAAENLRTETVTEYPGNAQVVDKRRRACAPGTRSSVLVQYGHTARQDQRLPAVSAAARRGWI